MSQIVRGNKLVVVDTPPPCTAQKTPTKDKWGICSHPKIGDHLWVASRKKNGWIRVKNARTELVTSLRVGPWVEKEAADWGRKPVTQPSNGVVALAAAASSMEPLVCVPPPSSSMDQLIRKSQVDRLEQANDHLVARCVEQSTKISELEALVAEQAERLAQDVALDNEKARRDTMWREKLAAAEHLIASQKAVMDTDDEVIREKNEKITELEHLIASQKAVMATDDELIRQAHEKITELERELEQRDLWHCSGSCCSDHEEDFVAVGLPVGPLPPTRTQSAA